MLPSVDTVAWLAMRALADMPAAAALSAVRAPAQVLLAVILFAVHFPTIALFRIDLFLLVLPAASTIVTIDSVAMGSEIIVTDTPVADTAILGGMRALSIHTGGRTPILLTIRISKTTLRSLPR
jgi:hypothetical protein